MIINRPIDIPRYLLLAVKQPLEPSQMRSWLAMARAHGPSGVVTSVQTTDDHGTLASVCLVHREARHGHAYLIPLTRDLLPEEVQAIVTAFAAAQPDLDFDIETNAIEIAPAERAAISLSDERHVALCTAMARARHENWMRARLAAGWRYGVEIDPEAKTHPLLRPWEQLPDAYRRIDLAEPQAVLDLINGQGLAVIGKDELERLLDRARH